MSPLIMSAVSMYLACCGGLGGRAWVRGDASWMRGMVLFKKEMGVFTYKTPYIIHVVVGSRYQFEFNSSYASGLVVK